MDDGTAEVGRVREEKRRSEKVREEKQRKKNAGARKGMKVAINSVFSNDLWLWWVEK